MREVFDVWVIGLKDGVIITINGRLDHDISEGLVFKQNTETVAVFAEYAYALKKES